MTDKRDLFGTWMVMFVIAVAAGMAVALHFM
jgi:hypothetical protein